MKTKKQQKNLSTDFLLRHLRVTEYDSWIWFFVNMTFTNNSSMYLRCKNKLKWPKAGKSVYLQCKNYTTHALMNCVANPNWISFDSWIYSFDLFTEFYIEVY